MHFLSSFQSQAEPQVSSESFPKGFSAAFFRRSCQPFLDYWAHTFPLLPGIRPVTPVCLSRHSACSSGEAKWTVAVSHCVCAWQSSSQPPLGSHQEMSFSNSFSNLRTSFHPVSPATKLKALLLLHVEIAKTTSALVKRSFEKKKKNYQAKSARWCWRPFSHCIHVVLFFQASTVHTSFPTQKWMEAYVPVRVCA